MTPGERLEAFEQKHGDWYQLLDNYMRARYHWAEATMSPEAQQVCQTSFRGCLH